MISRIGWSRLLDVTVLKQNGSVETWHRLVSQFGSAEQRLMEANTILASRCVKPTKTTRIVIMPFAEK